MVSTGPRGKGSKISVITEAHGIPLAVEVFGANLHDAQTVKPVLENAMCYIPKPLHLLGDGQYSSQPLTKELWKKYHVILTAPPKRHYVHFFHDGRNLRRIKNRWKVERCLSWFRGLKHLECRWEKKGENFLGFIRLACARILLRRLIIYG